MSQLRADFDENLTRFEADRQDFATPAAYRVDQD